MTNILAQIRLMGKTISLSTGVPVLNPDAKYSLELHAFSACWGEASLPLQHLAIGPDQPDWVTAYARPAGLGDEKACKKLRAEDPARSIPFGGLSSTNLFWVEDKEKYTHILMDIRNRRMVGVRAFSPEALKQRPTPWALLLLALEDPTFIKSLDARTGEFISEEMFDCAEAAGTRKVYACLHPAPVGAGGTALWAFDGIPWVRIEHPSVGVWEQAFDAACASPIPDPHFVG